MPRRMVGGASVRLVRFSSSKNSTATTTTTTPLVQHRRHVIFGANTDVGKTIVAAGLVRSSRNNNYGLLTNNNPVPQTLVQYVKPMQCGGSDERFVRHVLQLDGDGDDDNQQHAYRIDTLFDWTTPASPHTSSRLEGLPVSDKEVLRALQKHFQASTTPTSSSTITWYETAGGVLSPGAASPDNDTPWHARQSHAAPSSPLSWGWQPQADLYRPLMANTSTAILVGDARLGGISATLSSLESLLWRGYHVPALVLINPSMTTDENDSNDDIVHANAAALREYTQGRYQDDYNIKVVDLPAIPPDPAVPLDDWYRSKVVTETFVQLNQHLADDWAQRFDVDEDEDPESYNNDLSVTTPSDSSFALKLAQRYSRHGQRALQGAQASLMRHVVDDSLWASHSLPWSVYSDASIAVARAKAQRLALSLYQRRMRVTSEQRDSMEWAICLHSVPTRRSRQGSDEHDGDEGDDFSWVSAENLVLEAPTLAFADGKLRIRFPEGLEASEDTVTEFDSIEKTLDVAARRIAPKLYSQYKELVEMQWLVYEHSGITRKIGAIVVEPVLSSDHVWVDPLWQRALIEIGEARNIPIVFDETGLDIELKKESERFNVEPDIAIVASYPSASMTPIMTTSCLEYKGNNCV